MAIVADAIRREEEALSLTDSHPALSPENVYDYLANVFYARRSKINPLWNSILVGGWDHNKSEPFLGYVDLLGTTYSSPTLATGFGAHIAQPLLREAFEAKAGEDGTGEKLTGDEAEALIDECMKVLFYRDARSINKVSCAKIGSSTVTDTIVPNRYNYRERSNDFRFKDVQDRVEFRRGIERLRSAGSIEQKCMYDMMTKVS